MQSFPISSPGDPDHKEKQAVASYRFTRGGITALIPELTQAGVKVKPALIRFANRIAEACAFSRMHSSATRSALEAYGDHGPQISGVIRDHFPETKKDSLRMLCALITAASDDAWNNRPPRIRRATLLRLQQQIVRAVGSGFYGPQA